MNALTWAILVAAWLCCCVLIGRLVTRPWVGLLLALASLLVLWAAGVALTVPC